MNARSEFQAKFWTAGYKHVQTERVNSCWDDLKLKPRSQTSALLKNIPKMKEGFYNYIHSRGCYFQIQKRAEATTTTATSWSFFFLIKIWTLFHMCLILPIFFQMFVVKRKDLKFWLPLKVKSLRQNEFENERKGWTFHLKNITLAFQGMRGFKQ